MPACVEKTYADALFSLLVEDKADRAEFESVLAQLKAVRRVVGDVEDFVKFLNTPTISDEEKLALVNEIFPKEKTSVYVHNFLKLIAVKGRMGYFPQIYSSFRGMFNERFDIAEITVTSSMPLTDELREKITARMTQITGKSVSITERIDKSIIGGIMVDYGNTRYDGSIKTRLAELKKDISGVIA
jgi:F-type H+-transporting ATPase subunit delta